MPRAITIKKEAMENSKLQPFNRLEITLLVNEFKAEFLKQMSNLENKYRNNVKKLEHECMMYKMLLLPDERNLTLRELIQIENEKSLKEASYYNSTASTTSRSRKRSISCIIEDEGYLTEDSRNRNALLKRRTRSLSRTNICGPPSAKKVWTGNMSRMSRATFKTPAHGRVFNRTFNQSTFGLVTPKVVPNTPLTLLRRPMQGETAISMAGSPLLVSSVITDNTANVNIPMRNGTMLSLLPTKMNHISANNMPIIDAETRRQLKGLMENINTIVNFSDKHHPTPSK